MNDSKWIMILTIFSLGIFTIFLLGTDVKSDERGNVNVYESTKIEETIKEVRLFPNSIRSAYDGLVHVLGERQSKEDVIGHSNIGRVNICRVILDAMPIPTSKTFDDGMEYVGNIPNVPELRETLAKIQWPTMIAGSCNQIGSCIWSVLLKGKDCVKVESLDYYIGSTMEEFTSLPIGTQQRFLRTKGRCVGESGEQSCTVPIGDSRAIEGAEITVPYGWSRQGEVLTGIGGSY